MPQQVLDPHLERQGRGWAPRAGALHCQVDDAAVKAMEGLDYQQAITLFNQVLEKDDNSEAKIVTKNLPNKLINYNHSQSAYTDNRQQ